MSLVFLYTCWKNIKKLMLLEGIKTGKWHEMYWQVMVCRQTKTWMIFTCDDVHKLPVEDLFSKDWISHLVTLILFMKCWKQHFHLAFYRNLWIGPQKSIRNPSKRLWCGVFARVISTIANIRNMKSDWLQRVQYRPYCTLGFKCGLFD